MMPEIEMDWWKNWKSGRETKNLNLTAEDLDLTVEINGIKWLKKGPADFVTRTSSAANNVIDGASAELTKRITKQIDEIERARVAGRPLPNILE